MFLFLITLDSIQGIETNLLLLLVRLWLLCFFTDIPNLVMVASYGVPSHLCLEQFIFPK